MPRQRRDPSPQRSTADARLGGLTERALAALVPPKIFDRGVGYLEHGAVVDVAWRGDELHADVQGSEVEPYHVVAMARGDRLTARCDCPYGEEWGDWCKHVVAVLLLAIRRGDAIARRPGVAELVAAMDRDALARAVAALVDRVPALYDEVARVARVEADRRPR